MGLAALANACAHPVFDERAKELRARERVYPILSRDPHRKLLVERYLGVSASLERQIGKCLPQVIDNPLFTTEIYRVALARVLENGSSFEGRGERAQVLNVSSLKFFRFKWTHRMRLRHGESGGVMHYALISLLTMFFCMFHLVFSICSWFGALLLIMTTIVVLRILVHFHLRRLSARRLRVE